SANVLGFGDIESTNGTHGLVDRGRKSRQSGNPRKRGLPRGFGGGVLVRTARGARALGNRAARAATVSIGRWLDDRARAGRRTVFLQGSARRGAGHFR